MHAGVVVDRRRERAVLGDGHHRLDALAVGDGLVGLTERARGVHQAGALGGGDEVRRLDEPVGTGVPREVGHRRGVGALQEVDTGEPLDHLAHEGLGVLVLQLARVRRQPLGTEEVALLLAGERRLHDDVLELGVDHDREVRAERPRRRRPDQGQRALGRAAGQPHADGDGRVLPHLVDVLVHPQLVVGQRRLVVPAVGQHPEALVGEPLLPQLLEGPHDRLHVVEVEGLVVVVEVDPAGLPGHVVAPLRGVLEDRLPALRVERLDAHLEDLVGGLDAELAHRLELGRQAVGVPAEAALHPAAAHRLVARDEVLDVAGQEVAVVRQAVGERRAVVEDELVVAVLPRVALLDARPEGVVGLPVGEDALLDLREAGSRRHALVGACVRVGGDLRVRHRGVLVGCLFVTTRTTDLPRYHLACPALVRRDRSFAGCDGPTRPVLLGPSGPFFRRLAADDGSIACAASLREPVGAAPNPITPARRLSSYVPHTYLSQTRDPRARELRSRPRVPGERTSDDDLVDPCGREAGTPDGGRALGGFPGPGARRARRAGRLRPARVRRGARPRPRGVLLRRVAGRPRHRAVRRQLQLRRSPRGCGPGTRHVARRLHRRRPDPVRAPVLHACSRRCAARCCASSRGTPSGRAPPGSSLPRSS